MFILIRRQMKIDFSKFKSLFYKIFVVLKRTDCLHILNEKFHSQQNT